ncbi:RNA-guided endonuclease TnpB family protein, partial [Roseibium sp. RKSG952]|uniref:RNA-guided endonuclease InsQ/TnpB family protein n=1 Tax=Roseibium sp. RKSG952 TaxID=2529384 RepID=UPI0012BC1266
MNRPIEGEIKTVTVCRKRTGKFFASILVEDGREMPSTPGNVDAADAVGIDLGLTNYAMLSGVPAGRNVKVPNPRHYRKALVGLRRAQRDLSRKRQGSSNRAKVRLEVARAHERVANSRNDFQHKLSRLLVDENQAICVETLNVKGML